MKWIKNDQMVQDASTGEIICAVSPTPDELRDKIIEVAPELFLAVKAFIEGVETGSLKPKTAYNSFKDIFTRVPEHLMYDQRTEV